MEFFLQKFYECLAVLHITVYLWQETCVAEIVFLNAS